MPATPSRQPCPWRNTCEIPLDLTGNRSASGHDRTLASIHISASLTRLIRCKEEAPW